MNLIVLLTSIILTTTIFSKNDFQCLFSHKIEIVTDHDKKKEKHDFCINHAIYKIISLRCIKDHRCDAIKYYKSSSSLPVIFGEHGSPFHKKCYMIGGKAQLISFTHNKNTTQTGICKFKDDSFISVFNDVE